MEKVIAVAIFLIGASCFAQSKHESVRRVVLPNPALLRCTSSACSGLWQGDPPDANAAHPRQVSIDLWGNSCPLGLTALYDKSVSVDELKAAIDEQYGKWALERNATSPVSLWRVEPEKFAIQLAVDTAKKDGTKSVIYLAFTGSKCESQ